MDNIFKVVLTVILVVFITSTGSSIISTQQSMHNANSYFDSVTTVIAESHYSETVIADCIAEAEANGYTLRVEVADSSSSDTMCYAMAEMDYLYEISLLGVSEVKTLYKIA